MSTFLMNVMKKGRVEVYIAGCLFGLQTVCLQDPSDKVTDLSAAFLIAVA